MTANSTTDSGSMTGVLLRLQKTRFQHRLRNLDWFSTLLVVVLVVVGGVVVVSGLQRMWLSQALASSDPAFRRAEVLAAALRVGTLLAGIISFTTFGDLWRNNESEVIGQLPIPPRSMFAYRLVSSCLTNLPLLIIASLAVAPIAQMGDWALAAAAVAHLCVIYILTHLWGFYWHVSAAIGVGDPEVSVARQMSAGAITAPERAMLLYSPMFAMGTAFSVGFIFFLGLDGLFDNSFLGPLGLLGALVGIVMGWRKGGSAFEEGYYLGAAALADGEVLDGVFSEAVPSPDYFGQWYAERLPSSIRAFSRRDLKQAWRRNRLIPWAYVGASVLFALGRDELGALLWPVCLVLFVSSGAEAIRMAKSGADAGWMWFTLPRSVSLQVFARLASTLLYGLVIVPGVTWGLWKAGIPSAIIVLTLLSLPALATLATVTSLLFFAQGMNAILVYIATCGVVVYGALSLGGSDLSSVTLFSFLAGGFWTVALVGVLGVSYFRSALGALLKAAQEGA